MVDKGLDGAGYSAIILSMWASEVVALASMREEFADAQK